MSGDDRKRRCELCALHVYNTAKMTAAEIENLVLSHEGRLCIRLYRRADGTVLTSDCPVGIRAMRKRIAHFVGAALATMLGFFSVSFGQREKSGSVDASRAEIVRTLNQEREYAITGRILDPAGATIPNAELRLYREGDKKPRKVLSGDDGVYRFSRLSSGKYELEARYKGFVTRRVVGIEIGKPETLTINFALQVKGTGVWVGIFGEDPQIDLTSNTTATRITSEMIERLPH